MLLLWYNESMKVVGIAVSIRIYSLNKKFITKIFYESNEVDEYHILKNKFIKNFSNKILNYQFTI